MPDVSEALVEWKVSQQLWLNVSFNVIGSNKLKITLLIIPVIYNPSYCCFYTIRQTFSSLWTEFNRSNCFWLAFSSGGGGCGGDRQVIEMPGGFGFRETVCLCFCTSCHSVAQSYLSPWLCNPKDCSLLGLPVLHHLLEFAQTHVHRVSDAIQTSHPRSPPSPPALNLSQHRGLSQWVSSSSEVAKGLELQLQHQSFQWIFRINVSKSKKRAISKILSCPTQGSRKGPEVSGAMDWGRKLRTGSQVRGL